MDLTQFLGHQSSAGRGGGNYTKKWKDEKTGKGYLHTFLHPKAPILALYRHNVPIVKVLEDKDTKRSRTEVWSEQLFCWEDEETIQKQMYRNKETGERDYPPCRCGLCRMIEYFYDWIESGDLDWLTPVFKFEGDDPRKNIVCYAGGMCGMFGRKNLTDEQKEELKSKGIFVNEAYKHTWYPKLNYAFGVVDADDLKAGVTISIESVLLGDKVKEVIHKKMMDQGDEQGNPWLNPYCIRWEHHPKEKDIKKQYDAMPYGRIELSPAIQDLLNGPPPDMSSLEYRYNRATVRARLEQACLIKDLPWADWFPKPDTYDEQMKQEGVKVDYHAGNTKKKDDDRPTAAQVQSKTQVEMIDCDNCGKPMPVTSAKCDNCGQEYELEEEEKKEPPAPPPPKAPIKGRRGTPVTDEPSAATPPPPAAKSVAKASPPPPPKPPGKPGAPQAARKAKKEADAVGGDPGDDIPF